MSIYIKSVNISGEIPEGEYISSLNAVKNLKKMGSLPFKKSVTFFVGENGIGKSTLIEAIAINAGFNPEGGSRDFNFSTVCANSRLYDYISLDKGTLRAVDGFFLRAESFFNVASNIDTLNSEKPGLLDSYGGISLHELSHGEGLIALVKNRFRGKGLYILDEPESALSPTGLISLMILMKSLVKDDSQFIISTHSPILMTFPDSTIYELTDGGINSVKYDQTEHFLLTKQFLDSPERMLKYIFGE